MSKIFSTNQVRNPMDRLVSAYRNKLECRAGKEYYYKVKRYYHKKKNIVIRKTILNWIFKNAQNGLLCSLFKGKSCRSMEKKLFRVTEKLANSNSERKGVDKNSEIVSLNHLKHFMKNQRYKEMRNSHQDCHTEVPDLSDLLKHFHSVEMEPSFWEFVQYVLAHPTGDPHWKPFTQVCRNDQGKLTSSSRWSRRAWSFFHPKISHH